MPQPLWLSRLPFKDVLILVKLQVYPCAIDQCKVLLFSSLGLRDDDDDGGENGESCGGDVDHASKVFVSRILLSVYENSQAMMKLVTHI